MDRNTVTGFVLIFAMVIVYQLYFVPAPEPQAATTSQTSVTPEATDDATEIPTASNNVQDSTYVAKTGVLASDKLKVELTTDGGVPVLAELQDGYLDYWNKQPIQLWTPEGSAMNWIARGEGSYDQQFDLVSNDGTEMVMQNRGSGPLRSLTLHH